MIVKTSADADKDVIWGGGTRPISQKEAESAEFVNESCGVESTFQCKKFGAHHSNPYTLPYHGNMCTTIA